MGRALIVSAGASSNEYIAARLAEMGYARPVILPSGAEARRRMPDADFDLIVVNAPLPDEFGHELCMDAVAGTDAGVVFLVKAAQAEQLLAPLNEQGVLLLSKPFSNTLFVQAMHMAAASNHRLQRLRQENARLQDKISQIRLVSRAKCCLVEHAHLTEAEARALQSKLEAVPNVDSVTFVTAQQALENYKQRYVDSEYAELFDLPSEVLRHRYQIHVVDIEQLAQTVKDVEQVDGIAKTQAALDVAQGFVTVRNVAGAVAWILILMLLIISLFIIANTIKLATFHRREEIAIMKMCGATNGFIRWPFVVEGMILGLTGALVAFFIQWGLYEAVSRLILQTNGLSLITVLSYASMAGNIVLVFCGVGLVIGVGGSVVAIRKFLQV